MAIGAHFGCAMQWFKMAASLCIEANLINYGQESAEKDEIEP